MAEQRLIDANALIKQIEKNICKPCKKRKDDYNGVRCRACQYGDEIDDIEDAPTVLEWIPCSERLPEVGQDILMSVGGMYTAEGCLREDGDWAQFRWNAIQRKDMVGAWMPLPEPAKLESE